MAIPKYQDIMKPLLVKLGDGKEYRLRELVSSLSNTFALTDKEMAILLPNSPQPLFVNRVAWAKVYLEKAGLLITVRRGIYKITNVGLSELAKNPAIINNEYLMKFNSFARFKNPPKELQSVLGTYQYSDNKNQVIDPIESIANSFSQVNQQLATDLLEQVKSNTPLFFENLVADLLINMGYGSSKQDILQNSGKSGDGGIDGIIKEDILGFSKIYIQAKRWNGSVGCKEIRDFAGALNIQKASKGLFITTSHYTEEALDAISKFNGLTIVLIDGVMLCDLMIKYNLGVSIKQVYELKRIDEDYFADE